MKVTNILAVGLAAGLLAGAAEAATLRLQANTTCLSNCAAAGLVTGQAITARLRVDDAGFTPGGFLDDDDLLGFRVRFGGSTLSNENAFGSSFFAEWGATRNEFTTFSFQAASTEAPLTGPAFGLLNFEDSAFTKNGFCQNATCGVIGLGDYANAAPVTISAVPAPPALLLAASAVAGLAFAARRRRTPEHQPAG